MIIKRIDEIKGDKLHYTRTKILECSDDVEKSEVSIFQIENDFRILLDNYLSDYHQKLV